MLKDKDRQLNCVLLTGTAGVGKSNVIKEALRVHDIKAEYVKQNNFRDLLEAFDRASRNDRALVIEEADEFLRSPKQVNILKAASGPISERSYRFLETDEDGEKYWRTINLNVRLIMTSNADWSNPNSFTPAIRAHVRAISTRVATVHFNADKTDLWAYSCALAINQKMLLKPNDGRWFTIREQNLALEWFTHSLNRINDASPRTLIKIASIIGQNPNDPAVWEDDLSDIIDKPNASNYRPQVMPVVVPSP